MAIRTDSRALVLLMSAFVAIGPLSTDMYLPALPAMVDAFGTTLSAVQLTVSAYLAGFASFHLACGPLADRYGRKPVLLAGMAIFVLASAGCALAADIEQLIAFRFLQGIGACTGPTLARAMVRDIYGPQRAARALGYMAAIMSLAPVIAPSLGGWLLTWLPWPAIFWFLGGYALLAAVAVLSWLPESLPAPQSLRPAAIARNYLTLLASARYLIGVAALSALYAGAFAFISGSSFVLIDFMGVAPAHFGLWFIVMVSGYIGGSLFGAHYAQRFAPGQLTLGGALLGLASGAAMTVLSATGVHHPLAIMLPMAFYTGAVGIAMPHAMSAALAPYPQMAATASSLLGFLQMGAAAAVGALVGATLSGHPLPMALAITACGAVSAGLFLLARARER